MTFLKGCWLDNIYMPSSLKEGRRKGKQVVYPARRKLSCLANCSGEDQVGSKLPTLYDEDFLSLSLERGRRNGQLVVVCPCQAMAPFCLSVEGGAKPYRRLSWSLWRHGRGLAGAGDISHEECVGWRSALWYSCGQPWRRKSAQTLSKSSKTSMTRPLVPSSSTAA